MATAVQSQPTAAHQLNGSSSSSSSNRDDYHIRFPDGIKTSGQHPPLYEKIVPFSSFPQTITGPTVWNRDDYKDTPEKWVHRFTASEIEELSTAADAFLAAKTPLTAISKTNFQLSNTLSDLFFNLRDDLLNGKGFILFKGFPVAEWGLHKSAIAYMGLGTHLGYFVSQNGRGHVLGHVKDVGDDPTQIDKVRIYRTNARQFFHADDCDIVGLLCCARAFEGGESDIVSSHHAWNVIAKEHPDVAETLTQPIWYFDRKGEVSEGEDPYIRASLAYLEPGTSTPRLYLKYDPYFVRSLTRFSDAGEIPPLSAAQEKAIKVIEDTCNRLALHMILEVGDIQFLSNAHILHARTAYRDHAASSGKPRRHLMRLWLSTPESEGGWRLPYKDSDEKKRGGIQVNDNAHVCPLDAE